MTSRFVCDKYVKVTIEPSPHTEYVGILDHACSKMNNQSCLVHVTHTHTHTHKHLIRLVQKNMKFMLYPAKRSVGAGRGHEVELRGAGEDTRSAARA